MIKKEPEYLCKGLIVKTLIISQFIYITQSVGLPENTVNIINQKLHKFMWKKKYNNKKAVDKSKCKIQWKTLLNLIFSRKRLRHFEHTLRIDRPYWDAKTGAKSWRNVLQTWLKLEIQRRTPTTCFSRK